MSGENFKNPIQVESNTAGVSVSNVVVVDRNTLTFDIDCDDSGVNKGGHSLTYRTREGFDGSEVEVRNNLVILPKEPQLDGQSLDGRNWAEIGSGAAESEHDAGHDATIIGEEFYDLDQVEAALQDGADFASIGLEDADGNAVVASSKPCRVRIGELSADGQTWTDDPAITVTINSVTEGTINITMEIDESKELADTLDAAADAVLLDLCVETYSGDLGSKSPADNYMRAQFSGDAAISQEAFLIRRARPQSIEEIIKLDANTLPTPGDAASIAAAKAAGEDQANFAFRQGDTERFYLRVESAHANKKCLDTSAILRQAASATSPAGGQIHSNGEGGSIDFSVGAGGLQSLTLLSETELMVQIAAREDQELGTYSFTCMTDSSEGSQVAIVTFDLLAGVFEFTVLDIALTSPEVMYAQSGPFAATAAGDGLPAGYELSEAGGEVQVAEGSVAVVAKPISNAAFSLKIDDIVVQDDDNMSFTMEHRPADVTTYGGDFEQTLGNYNVTITVTDATGADQVASQSMQVQHKFPPELDSFGGADSENVIREDSLNNPGWDDDIVEVDMIKLRGDTPGSGAAGNLAAINGISSFLKGTEAKLKLCLNDGADNYADISTVWEHDAQGILVQPDPNELVTSSDAPGSVKPMILITDVSAAKTGGLMVDVDGNDQEVYKWSLNCRMVAEEAMMQTAYAPAGLDSGAGYGQRFALAVQVADAEGDGFTDWAYYDDIGMIVPDNVEVAAAAYELARASAEAITMSGDNMYPPGAGNGVGAGAAGGGGAPAFGMAILDANQVGIDVSELDGPTQQGLLAALNASVSPQLQDAAAGPGGGTVDLVGASFSLDSGELLIDLSGVGTSVQGKVDFNGWNSDGPVQILGIDG